MSAAPHVPVIVGVGQVTDTRSAPGAGRSPLELMHEAARLAATDAGAGERLLRSLDSLTVIRLFSDTAARFASPFGRIVNPPWSLARRLGADPEDLVYPPQGGDSPQRMVARACERIAAGQSQAALVVGGEAMRTELAARRAGIALDWAEDAPGLPDDLGGSRPLYTEAEQAHGMGAAIPMYALIGQALRRARGQNVPEYQHACAQLFARFARVAQGNPLATRRDGHDALEIASPSLRNPYVGYPYTKLMTASAFVDQAAAVLIVSTAMADAMGIASGKRIHLHGSASAHDRWHASDRVRLDASPAMRLSVGHALDQAGIGLDRVSFLDLYSCFPSVVQIACQELGLAHDDPRGLTLTGGLAYFGGPGNNYAAHAIAHMVHRLRSHPGAHGLVLANGGPVTKQAVGVYGSTPPAAPFRHESASIQGEIDRADPVPLAHAPAGEASIETYTLLQDGAHPGACVLFGRLTATGERFVARTPDEPALLRWLQSIDALGLPGVVAREGPCNVFSPRRP